MLALCSPFSLHIAPCCCVEMFNVIRQTFQTLDQHCDVFCGYKSDGFTCAPPQTLVACACPQLFIFCSNVYDDKRTASSQVRINHSDYLNGVPDQ